MTEDNKRIKIAEHCGIIICAGCLNAIDDQVCCCGDDTSKHNGWEGHSATAQGCTCGYAKQPQHSWAGVPDYFRDLNAMHEVEMSLNDEQRKTMRGQMGEAERATGKEKLTGIVHATAAQRAEAFGLTLKLWNNND